MSGAAASDVSSRLRHRLIPAVPAIFGNDGRLDRSWNERYAAWMARQEVGAVALWAHTGRGLHLDAELRRSLLDSWREAIGDVPIVCGVGVTHGHALPAEATARTRAVIDATVVMARDAQAGGAAAVMVHPPTALRDLPDLSARVLDLHQAVAGQGLPTLGFYLYTAAGGVAYDAATVEQLLAVPGVIGIKVATLDSIMTFQDLVPVVRNQPGSLLVTGEDRFLGSSLMLGADAALVGLGATCTNLSTGLLSAWFERDLTRFVERSAAVDTLAQAIFRAPMEGYVQRLLWALEADGVIAPDARDPYAPPLGDAERALVATAVVASRLR